MKITDYPKVYNINDLPQPDGVYILHFTHKIKHSGHYIGYSNDIRRRLTEHRNKNNPVKAVGIIRELHRLGFSFEPVLFFPGADTNFEFFLKKKYKGTPKLCPICIANGWTPTPISEIHKFKKDSGKNFTPLPDTAPVFVDDGVFPF